MRIDLTRGFTGKISLDDGTVLTVIGGLTAGAEKDGEVIFKGPVYVTVPDEIYAQGQSGIYQFDSKTTVAFENGLITNVNIK